MSTNNTTKSRAEITKWLTDLLISKRLSGMGKHYATEVTLDMGTRHSHRIDVVQFVPKGGTYASDIEKGIFICYKIKSCIEDIYSGHGLNFYGEKNYLVMTMETWIKVQDKGRDIWNWIRENKPEDANDNIGILVPVPYLLTPEEYYERVKERGSISLTEDITWELKCIMPCNERPRKRSMSEMLFCMLRAGR